MIKGQKNDSEVATIIAAARTVKPKKSRVSKAPKKTKKKPKPKTQKLKHFRIVETKKKKK